MRNTSNAYTLRFGKAALNTYPIRLEYEGKAIAFSCNAGELKSIGTDYALPEALTGMVNVDESVVYEDVSSGIDIIYSAVPMGVKEYIVINAPTEENEFIFDVDVEGVNLISSKNGISIVNEQGEDVFYLNGMYAFDSANRSTGNIQYTLNGTNQIKLRVDKNWLESEDRVYPIIVDPSVIISGVDVTYDACITSLYPNTNYYVDADLRSGMECDYGVRRSLIKFDMPSGIESSQITLALISLKKHSGAAPTMHAYRIISDWSSSSVTWNTQPQYTTVGMSGESFHEANGWYSVNVTTIVKGWIGGDYTNRGVILIDDTEDDENHWSTYYSSDADYPNRPEFVIYYSEGTTEDGGNSGENSSEIYPEIFEGHPLKWNIYTGDKAYLKINGDNLDSNSSEYLNTIYSRWNGNYVYAELSSFSSSNVDFVTSTEAYWEWLFPNYNDQINVRAITLLTDTSGLEINGNGSNIGASTLRIRYARICMSPQNVFYNQPSSVRKTMTHELGHVLGLGHQHPLGEESVMKVGELAYENVQAFDWRMLANKYGS